MKKKKVQNVRLEIDISFLEKLCTAVETGKISAREAFETVMIYQIK